MTDKEVMQLALVALEEAYHPNTNVAVVMEALRAKLEQTDMQIGLTYEEANPPVAWMYVNTDEECEQIEYGEPLDDPSVTPLYTAPPQREWVGLTDDEYIQLLDKAEKDAPKTGSVFKNLWYAINTKLKEKNNDK
jgi:hypothetical protein